MRLLINCSLFYSRIKLPSLFVISIRKCQFVLKRINVVSSHFICEKYLRIFCRCRRDPTPEQGSGRNPGNRVPRNYRRRNRFRDSLPECTRWNTDSPRRMTSIYRNHLRNQACQKLNFFAVESYIYYANG